MSKTQDLLKKAERNYLRRMRKYEWFNESEKPFKPSLRYYKKLNVFKGSNVSFHAEKIEAYSYRWWKFVKIIDGKVVFNNYSYSNTTSQHQSKVRMLMQQLGIKIDVMIETPQSLEHKNCLVNAIQFQKEKINKLKELISKPKSRKVTNIERYIQIKEREMKIKEIESLITLDDLLEMKVS